MTKEEEKALYAANREESIRYIRAKLPGASDEQLFLVATFIRALGVEGWNDEEFWRSL